MRIFAMLVPALVGSILLTSVPARAQPDPDPWFGRDKALHFAASATIASGTYAIAATQFRARYPALIIGGGVAIAVGAAKETLDMLGYGDPSWRDFTWDVIGTAVGLGVAWGLDLLIRGVSNDQPVFGAPISNAPARTLGFSW